MRIATRAVLSGLALASAASAQVRITEYLYDGVSGEYVEFTNVGAAAIDMTGWSFEDNNHPAGSVSYYSLSPIGNIQPGESIILTQALEADFRAAWSLPASVRVLDQLGTIASHNLGRNDTINLLDASLNIVDVLRYGDQDFPGSVRATGRSANPLTPAALGANDPYQWVLATAGDSYGSYPSAGGESGNPGTYVPEPASLALLGIAGLIVARRR